MGCGARERNWRLLGTKAKQSPVCCELSRLLAALMPGCNETTRSPEPFTHNCRRRHQEVVNGCGMSGMPDRAVELQTATGTLPLDKRYSTRHHNVANTCTRRWRHVMGLTMVGRYFIDSRIGGEEAARRDMNRRRLLAMAREINYIRHQDSIKMYIITTGRPCGVGRQGERNDEAKMRTTLPTGAHTSVLQ